MRRFLDAACAGLLVTIASCSGGDGPPDATLVSIELTPASATLQEGATQQFTATAHFSDGGSEPAVVTWTSSGGLVSATGFYFATDTGSFQVVATERGGTLSRGAAITVTPIVPVLQAIFVTPEGVALAPGATQQFIATGIYSPGRYGGGRFGNVAVNWSAFGGTITTSGLYTAGATSGGVFAVTATLVGGSMVGYAGVTITAPPP